MERCFKRKLVRGLVLLMLAGATPSAHAQAGDQATAQALFDEARQLLADGKAAEACPKFEESQRLDPGSGTLLNLASCYEQMGRLASAWGTYLEAAAAAKRAGNAERETVARDLAGALVPRLSKLVITISPGLEHTPGLEITRDGTVVRAAQWGLALPADPGEHEVTASAPGYATWQSKVQVAPEAATETVTVPELVKQPDGPDTSKTGGGSDIGPQPSGGLGVARVAALVAGGVGVVGLGAGAYFGLQAKSKLDEADKYCEGGACTDQRGVTAGKDARTDGNISTALIIVGGVGLATGVTLWLTAPKRQAAPSARVGVGIGSVQLRGAW